MFTSEIGDAKILHGIIAVTLYVRTADVVSGALDLSRRARALTD